MSILTRVVGSKNERQLARLRARARRIASLEPAMKARSDQELRALSGEFRRKLERGAGLDKLLPETFAAVREASSRVLGMRHHDVQVLGGLVLHSGAIAEMRTGEGKTLVATLPAYLNALGGKGVHVVTVNDYLARRDAEWMGRIYHFLGLSVGTIVHGLDNAERQRQYDCDITYGQNNELGFDYLRDNMNVSPDRRVQKRGQHYCIVDEVDSILIDEARTPLIISTAGEGSNDLYQTVDRIVSRLREEIDYTVDREARTALLTERGVDKVETALHLGNLYDPAHLRQVHHVNQALRAHALYKRDVEYLVRDDRVIIIDDSTGRPMKGRRWSDGLHQAIEAKEGVTVQAENRTRATITFQNYFRLYDKLSGMTGTADTEAPEFHQIYQLDVTVIPTHRPVIRHDAPDLVYRDEKARFRAVLRDIRACHERGQPVLVGTASVAKSEVLAGLLAEQGLSCEVLNARHHEREARIVAQAGRKGAITIATSMAGRGTDIVLGGNPEKLAEAEFEAEYAALDHERAAGGDRETRLAELTARYQAICAVEREHVLAAGGLQVIGTERHESRRIDNQLRGRSGRQGDPGGSRFYLSLDDELFRNVDGDGVARLMERLGVDADVPLEHWWITRSIENAQKRVEGRNFDRRKRVLEYDDVLDQQRKAIYRLRWNIVEGRFSDEDFDEMSRRRLDPDDDSLAMEPQRQRLHDLCDGLLRQYMVRYCPAEISEDEWDLDGLADALSQQFHTRIVLPGQATEQEIAEAAWAQIVRHLGERERQLTRPWLYYLLRHFYLEQIDEQWIDHLGSMEHLRQGVHLRRYARQDPRQVYRREGFERFRAMRQRIDMAVASKLFAVEVQRDRVPGREQSPPRSRVGRNAPCPCGSGKTFRTCHGGANPPGGRLAGKRA